MDLLTQRCLFLACMLALFTWVLLLANLSVKHVHWPENPEFWRLQDVPPKTIYSSFLNNEKILLTAKNIFYVFFFEQISEDIFIPFPMLHIDKENTIFHSIFQHHFS